MPVGLEETFHGVKVAPDVTYTNTFQFPEKNSKVTALQPPSNKPLCRYINAKITFAKPNLDIIARPNTRHAFEETRASLDALISRGLVKSRQKEDKMETRPIAFLHRVPTTTPLHPKRPQNRSSKRSAPQYHQVSRELWSGPHIIGKSTAPPSSYGRCSAFS